MANSGRTAVQELAAVLKTEGLLEAKCAEVATAAGIDAAPIEGPSIGEFQIAADLAEKGAGVRYPSVSVYCDKVVNSLLEKFRTFSGTADLVVEIRVSHDHADVLQGQLQVYVEAVTSLLDEKRGRWSNGMHYAGGYEVAYSPVKRGGKNYLQTARVKLQVHISTI